MPCTRMIYCLFYVQQWIFFNVIIIVMAIVKDNKYDDDD